MYPPGGFHFTRDLKRLFTNEPFSVSYLRPPTNFPQKEAPFMSNKTFVDSVEEQNLSSTVLTDAQS